MDANDLPTEPESPETIALQMEQMGDGARKVVMFPDGQNAPTQYPPGIRITHGAPWTDESGQVHRNLYAYRPDQTTAGAIHAAEKNNTLPELLGGPMGMGAPGYGAPMPPSKNSRTPQQSADDIALGLKELGSGFRQIVMFRSEDEQPDKLPPGASWTIDEFGTIYAHRTGFLDGAFLGFKSILSEERPAIDQLRLLYKNLSEHERHYVAWRWDDEYGQGSPYSRSVKRYEERKRRNRQRVYGVLLVVASVMVYWWVWSANTQIREGSADVEEMGYLRDQARHDAVLAKTLKDAEERMDSGQP